MKKFKFFIILIAFLSVGLYLYSISDINVHASVNGNITSPESSGALGQFSADKDTTFTVYYSSKVKDGTLELYIEDSNGNIVDKFPVNTKASEEISFPQYDTYSLKAEYTNFIGNFHVKIK